MELMHSDHYAMMLTLQDLPAAGQTGQQEKEVRWNIAKKGGWQRYHDLTKNKSEAIAKIVAKEEDIEDAIKKIERIESKIKFQAFGKCSIKKRATVRGCS